MADTMGISKTNIEWLTEQAAQLRLRSNPCAGQTPLIVMADRFDNTVMEIQRLRSALSGLVNVLAENDQDGLTEFAEQMIAARAALK